VRQYGATHQSAHSAVGPHILCRKDKVLSVLCQERVPYLDRANVAKRKKKKGEGYLSLPQILRERTACEPDACKLCCENHSSEDYDILLRLLYSYSKLRIPHLHELWDVCPWSSKNDAGNGLPEIGRARPEGMEGKEQRTGTKMKGGITTTALWTNLEMAMLPEHCKKKIQPSCNVRSTFPHPPCHPCPLEAAERPLTFASRSRSTWHLLQVEHIEKCTHVFLSGVVPGVPPLTFVSRSRPTWRPRVRNRAPHARTPQWYLPLDHFLNLRHTKGENTL